MFLRHLNLADEKASLNRSAGIHIKVVNVLLSKGIFTTVKSFVRHGLFQCLKERAFNNKKETGYHLEM